jgi:outer membrane PBP1 activator LpoA protein
MLKPLVIIACFVVAACTSGASSPSAPTTSAPQASASGACIDREQLADDANTVGTAMPAIAAAVKAGNGDQARSLATGVVAGMRKLADLVEPQQADAAKGFRGAADKLEGAASAFPQGQATVDDVQKAFDAAYELARTAVCPA